MRKINGTQIAVFCSFLLFVVLAAAATTWLILGQVPLGDFRGVVLTLGFGILLYGYALLLFRLYLCAFPLDAHYGNVRLDSGHLAHAQPLQHPGGVRFLLQVPP